MDDDTGEFRNDFSGADPPGEGQGHRNDSDSMLPDSLLISHAISGQLKLNAASRDQLANLSQVRILYILLLVILIDGHSVSHCDADLTCRL